MGDLKYTAEEITALLAQRFAAPLIITTVGWILYGVNICQFLHYMQVLVKRDHIFTRVLVCIVFFFTSANSFYNIYCAWTYSITLFQVGATEEPSITNGTSVVLYSVVIMLVHFFWLGVVYRLISNTNPTLSWIVITPIGILSFSAFILATSVGVLSRTQNAGDGSWPTSLVSILLRIALGFDVGVDVAILAVIITQLTALRKTAFHLRRTISKLLKILCFVTLVSTLVMITELVIDFPQLGHGGFIPIAITFAPIMAPLYSLGFFAVLNERTRLWSDRRTNSNSRNVDSKGLVPGMRFVVDAAPQTTTTSPGPPTTEPIPRSNTASRKPEADPADADVER